MFENEVAVVVPTSYNSHGRKVQQGLLSME